MSIFTKILGSGTVEKITDSVGEIIDKTSTSDEEKSTLKNRLSDLVLSSLVSVIESQKQIIIQEAQGNFLQRSWRPILGLSFGFIVVATYFIFPTINLILKSEDLHALILELKDNTGFWDLMKLMIGGYVAGRTIEKTAETVTKNIDLPFVKKKNREL